MGVYSNNRTNIFGYDSLAESYGVLDSNTILIENAKNDMALFEGVIADDIICALNEGTFDDIKKKAKKIYEKIKEMIKSFLSKVKSIIVNFKEALISYCKEFYMRVKAKLGGVMKKDYKEFTVSLPISLKDAENALSDKGIGAIAGIESIATILDKNLKSDNRDLTEMIDMTTKDILEFQAKLLGVNITVTKDTKYSEIEKKYFEDKFSSTKEKIHVPDSFVKMCVNQLTGETGVLKSIMANANNFDKICKRIENTAKSYATDSKDQNAALLLNAIATLMPRFNTAMNEINNTHMKEAKKVIALRHSIISAAIAYNDKSMSEFEKSMKEISKTKLESYFGIDEDYDAFDEADELVQAAADSEADIMDISMDNYEPDGKIPGTKLDDSIEKTIDSDWDDDIDDLI